jgi:hypothetical protein
MNNCPHIGEMISRHIKAKRYHKSAWGREHGVQPATVNGYLRTPVMKTDTLFVICQTLEYNFFKELAAALPEQLPPLTVSENETRIKELEQRVRELELQNAVYEKALQFVGGRK